jgi:hypothetical protein
MEINEKFYRFSNQDIMKKFCIYEVNIDKMQTMILDSLQ